MADIFREVDEEVRKDRARTLWQRYGIYVYIVIGALVVGTAGNQYWQYYREQQRLEESALYQEAVEALQRQQTTEAINGFARLGNEGGTGYQVLGRLREAAARAENGDLSGAVRAYDQLASDGDVDAVYRDLARLLAAMHLVNDGDADAVSERVGPLRGDGQPWRFSAREIEAVLALRENRRQEAREILQGLVDDAETPSGVRGRANELLAALAAEE